MYQLYKGPNPLATFIPQIVDNLTTDDSTKALSAKQGKVLNEKTESETITVTNKSSTIFSVNAFRIGKLVVIDFYCYDVTANSVLFTLPESVRPSENKTAMSWLPTDSSSYGSKTFTLNYTNGNMVANSEVYRGNVNFIYSL